MTTLLELRWHGRMLFAVAFAHGVLAIWLGDAEFTIPPRKIIDSLVEEVTR